eukprot:355362-Chlamydomonas_euryale.AAC.3
MKSSDMRYSSRVWPRLAGMHTCSWCKWREHCSAVTPRSILPGCASPMCESTMHGGWNAIAMG